MENIYIFSSIMCENTSRMIPQNLIQISPLLKILQHFYSKKGTNVPGY